jgi:hypothetical protein
MEQYVHQAFRTSFGAVWGVGSIIFLKMKSISSPFSEKMLNIQQRKEKITFRNKVFEIKYHFYEDAGHQFTTDEVDDFNLQQVYNQYFIKKN